MSWCRFCAVKKYIQLYCTAKFDYDNVPAMVWVAATNPAHSVKCPPLSDANIWGMLFVLCSHWKDFYQALVKTVTSISDYNYYCLHVLLPLWSDVPTFRCVFCILFILSSYWFCHAHRVANCILVTLYLLTLPSALGFVDDYDVADGIYNYNHKHQHCNLLKGRKYITVAIQACYLPNWCFSYTARWRTAWCYRETLCHACR